MAQNTRFGQLRLLESVAMDIIGFSALKDPARVRYRSDGERWAAVKARDRRADGRFVYSVSTTGVYCRPACPSRLARREHVHFHATCEEAERAGFRACKRCRPNAPVVDQQAVAVAKACRLIATAHELPNLQALAAAAGLSAYHFHRVFRKATGLTPKGYATAHRAGRLRTELARTRTITDAMYAAGFNSSGGFYANSRTTLGMKAQAFRRAGAGEHVSFALARSVLGWVLVAATEKGICEIALGDEPQALTDDLKRRFANATLNRDRAFGDVLEKVVAHIEAPERPFELPLDLRGTLFQQRVWHALRGIPPGTTISYKELADRLAAPTSVRAVARACASNTIAIAVPCHRVIRSDGTLAGYRWGTERKRVLLERERTRHRKAG